MTKLLNPWRVFGWSVAAMLLLIPAIAMRFTSEVQWDETDFIVMGGMLAIAGLALELLLRRSRRIAFRLGALTAVFAGFFVIWANLAVGMIGSEDNPYNLRFGAVLGVAIVGAILSRARPPGLAATYALAALVQIGLGAAGLPLDQRGGLFTMIAATPWLIAAALMWQAGRPVNGSAATSG